MKRHLVLYEYECVDCEELILLEHEKSPMYCPYCGDADLEFTPGRIAPALIYKPKENAQ